MPNKKWTDEDMRNFAILAYDNIMRTYGANDAISNNIDKERIIKLYLNYYSDRSLLTNDKDI